MRRAMVLETLYGSWDVVDSKTNDVLAYGFIEEREALVRAMELEEELLEDEEREA